MCRVEGGGGVKEKQGLSRALAEEEPELQARHSPQCEAELASPSLGWPGSGEKKPRKCVREVCLHREIMCCSGTFYQLVSCGR